MAINDLIRILDPHREIAVFLDNRDVVLNSGGEQLRCGVVRLQLRAFQPLPLGHIAAAADVCLFRARVSRIADVISIHVVVVGLHRWHLSQFTPLRDVFRVRAITAASRLNIQNGDAVGCLIEPGVFVFDLQVALEAVLRPQHHVMGIILELWAGRQSHALRAVRYAAHFAIKKPLRLPILRTGITKRFRPLSSRDHRFEGSHVPSGIGCWLIRHHMDGEQKRGNEGGKTACHFRSNHGNLVVFHVKGSHFDVDTLMYSFMSNVQDQPPAVCRASCARQVTDGLRVGCLLLTIHFLTQFLQAFDGNGRFHFPRIKDRTVRPLNPGRLHARRDGADDVKRIPGNQPRVI